MEQAAVTRTRKDHPPSLLVCHEVQRFPNPLPHRNPGGDCFACAAYAIVRHFYGDAAPSFSDVWEAFLHPNQRGRTDQTYPSCANYPGYKDALERIRTADGRGLEVRNHLTRPEYNVDQWEASFYWRIPYQEWWHDLHAYLSAGWVAIAHVNQAGIGPVTPCGRGDGSLCYTQTDHILVIDGARRFHYEEFENGEFKLGSLEYEVHVVDSANSKNTTGWHPVHDWLIRHGASGLHMVRPDTKWT